MGATPVAGSSGIIRWSKPTNISDSPPLSTHPAIVSDDYGNIHVFWSEELGGRARQPGDIGGEGNSIVYTRWDGTSWTDPVDILSVPEDTVAEFVAVDVDTDSRLHIVWTGQTNFYYSNALSWEADSAHAWRKPVVIATNSARSRLESNIAVGGSGDIHIIYAARGTEAGIYYIRSQDGGETWSMASLLSEPFDALERSYSTVRIIADEAGRLHAVWQTSQQEGFGQAIYYTRSADQGQSWSTPKQLAYRDPGDTWVDWPYLMAEGDSKLHLLYVDGSSEGREHRISVDSGETWSDPYHIITEMEGINGYVFPLVDNSDQMHLIVNMRTSNRQIVGVYYSQQLDNTWSPVVPIDITSPAAPSAHYTTGAMRLGNEIHIVYNQISTGEIWHMRGTLPDVDPEPTPTPIPSPTAPPSTVTATPEATAPAIQSEQQPLDLLPTSSNLSSVPFTILPGLGLVLVLVAGTVLWARVRTR
jgi:hypothetical protein